MTTIFTERDRFTISWIFWLGFIVFMIYRACTGILISQLNEPVLHYLHFDKTLLAFYLTGITTFFAHTKWFAIATDICLFVFPIYFLMQVKKGLNSKTVAIWLALLFSILCFTYFIVTASLGASSTHVIAPYLFMPLLFVFAKTKNFFFYFRAIRYYLCFIFVSAALWKICRGAAFNLDQMSAILSVQHVNLLASDSLGLLGKFYWFLIENQWLSYTIYLLGVIVELSFFIGFLTKKFDKFLLLALIAFVTFNALIMQIEYWEYLLFGICLLFPKRKVI